MVFSSVSFLFYFLPVTLIIYYLVPRKWTNCKNTVLLLASLFFYFYGEQQLVLVMLFSAAVDYVCSLVIEKFRHKKPITKISLVFSLTANIALLGYFKYYDFFAESISQLFGLPTHVAEIALPIGISFYTFQTMSYTIDVYKNRIKAQKNPITYTTFVTMFSQLIAGPIVRYGEISHELTERRNTFSDFSYGVRRFILGLSKKILLANTLAELAQTIMYSGEQTVLFAWMSAVAFFFQLYFDFSGYSDMAIGLGKMFGFSFPENFNYPYIARSFTDFWKRWHMTLTRWFRDYVYIPLGGSKVSELKWIRNIMLVWLITGLWHGAAWNFVIWGVYCALFLITEKFLFGKLLAEAPKPFAHLYTIAVVLFGLVIVNADNLTDVGRNFSAMFGTAGLSITGAETMYYLRSYGVVFIVAIVASTPLLKNLYSRICGNDIARKAMMAIEPVMLIGLLIWTTGFLVDGSFNPFIYFRF